MVLLVQDEAGSGAANAPGLLRWQVFEGGQSPRSTRAWLHFSRTGKFPPGYISGESYDNLDKIR